MIDATVYPNMDPCPRVEILITDLPTEVVTLTLIRVVGGREMEVRGALRAPTGGGFTRIDNEVPTNVPVTYRAQLFGASGGDLGYTDPVTVTVPSVETVMHNPLAPRGAVKVTLRDNAMSQIVRPTNVEIVHPRGRRVGIAVVDGPRRGITGAVFDVWCDDLQTADAIQAFGGDYTTSTVPIVCIRVGSADGNLARRLPAPLFLGLTDLHEEDRTVQTGGEVTVQVIGGDEVAPPTPGLFIPLLTRADLNAFYATRADLNADNLTRLDVNRRYDIAGAAS